MQKILCALFIASTIVYAGGAASLVGKKSSSKGYSYDPLVEMRFINDCAEDANRLVCKCVLEKIKGQYSEKEYKKIDKDLRNNIPQPEFVDFVSKASRNCDEENLPTNSHFEAKNTQPQDDNYNTEFAGSNISEEMSEAEAKEYVKNFVKNIQKKDFVPPCAEDSKKMLGTKNAEKVCGCAFDHMVNDKPRFITYVMENGIPEEDSWGAEYIIECMPEKFTPEIKKNFIEFLNKEGMPKSLAQCIVNNIEKEYSLKNLVAAKVSSEESFKGFLSLVIAKCLIPE